MRLTLAFRHLVVRPGRSLVLLAGYAIGVAVMIVLLSVGDAMLLQSRDVSLVGGGDLTVLPEGIDVEALRTGGMTGMFFGIDRARFVTRQLLGGPRHASVVRAVSPILEGKRIALTVRDTTWILRGGADLPTVAALAGAPLDVVDGQWGSPARDAGWWDPAPQQFYDEIDHFHFPRVSDSTWGEWHYFNVVVSADEWWYITVLVGGDMTSDRWGGQVLVTRRTNVGHERFVQDVPRAAVQFDTTRADLVVGSAAVIQRDGEYRLRGSVKGASFDLTVVPDRNAYFPPVELRDDRVTSGYVVPALAASASGQLCVRGQCRTVNGAPSYHDHNWGVWRGITWEWGSGRGTTHSLVYGGVRESGNHAEAGSAPFFIALVDSLGVRQVYRFARIEASDFQPVKGQAAVQAPGSLRIVAARYADTVVVAVKVLDVHATQLGNEGPGRVFLQMRGEWTISGSAAGELVSDRGTGFFETWIRPSGNGSRR
ncbi:MAG: ABC transporter permease [Gemmatimonadales bacterium]